MKHAVCPAMEWPLILMGAMLLCLGGILSVDLTIPIVVFLFTVLGVCEKSAVLLYVAILLFFPSI